MIRHWYWLFLFFIFIIPSTLSGQEQAHRIEAEAVSLSELISLLEENYDVHFSYASDLLSDQLFYLKTSTPDLQEILNEITAIYPLEYQLLSDQSILLRDKLLPTSAPVTSLDIRLSIKDGTNNQALESVAVGLSGTTQGAYSDENGIVSFSVQKENNNNILEIHLLGYQSKSVSVNSAKVQEVFLYPLPFSIEEVMIQDQQDVLRTNSIDHKIVLKTQHISALTTGLAGNDIFRQAQLLPGVAAHDDISSGLKIRGSDEEASLIILDEIPIYNASHYYGIFSSINSSYVSSTTLYKNNLPLAYDGKTAGMLQVFGPSMDSSYQAKGSLDLNLLSMSGAFDLPLSKGLSLSIAGRTTYQNVSDTDLFSLFNNPENEAAIVENFSLASRDRLLSSVPDFTFYDLNSKLQYIWNNNSLVVNYYRSSDDLNDTFENQFRTRRQQVVIENTERYSNTEIWENEGASLKLESRLSDHMLLTAVGYFTSYQNRSGLDIDLSRKIQRQVNTFQYDNFRKNEINDVGGKLSISHFSESLNWQAGVDVAKHDVTIDLSETEARIQNNNDTTFEASLYASINPTFSSGLQLEIGARATYFKDNIYPSPRLNIQYPVNENLFLKASLGRHNQFVRQLSYENIFGRTQDFWLLADTRAIKVSKADQVMLGFNHSFGRFNLDVEGYYRKNYDILELALLNPKFNENGVLPTSTNGGNEYRLFDGDGETLGIDFLLGLTLPRYSGWIAYTLSKSDVQYNQILRGTTFPSQDDRRHQFKLVNEFLFGQFTLGANFIYSSGRPYTDLSKVIQDLRRDELRPEDRISRLPDYIRTDLGLNYSFHLIDTKLDLGISVHNLFNRQNVNYIQYLFSISSNSSDNPNMPMNTVLGSESNLLDRTINLNMKLSF